MPSQASDDPVEEGLPDDPPATGGKRSRTWTGLVAVGVLLVLGLGVAWLSRERIADNLIARELAKRGVPATYKVEAIGPREQILTDIVIGNPQRPDFTAERAVVSIRPRFGFPEIGTIKVVRPRLYGTFLKGKLSFGALDPLIFTDSAEPFRLPDMDLAIDDGRGLIETDHGAVGIKAQGRGNLRGGFSGVVAATAPGLALGDCGVERLTVYGRLSVTRESPRFDGPVRLAGLACRETGLRLANADLAADLKADSTLDRLRGELRPEVGRLSWSDYRMAGANGSIDLDWSAKAFLARYDLAGRSVEAPQFVAPRIALTGQLRAADAFSSVDLQGDLSGAISRPGTPLLRSLDQLGKSGEGTLLSDLTRKASAALRREASGATFEVGFTARRRPEGDTLTVPGAELRGSGGQALVSLSRLQIAMGEGAPQFLAGSFVTGGPDLPRLSGNLRRNPGGGFSANIAMAEYAAGDARLSVPRLAIVERAGRLGFAGEVQASGSIPGGAARNLAVPVAGDWSEGTGLALWRNCAQVRFDSLRLSGLDLARRALALCPPPGGAIVRSGPDGLRIAAGAPSLDLAGRLGGTPVRIESGAVGFAWPGTLAARAIDVKLGPARSASRFRIERLSARTGSDIAGTFANATVALDAVPLDLSEISGRWRYANGILTLSDGALRLTDREQIDRFQPLVAEGAKLRLADNRITASALLREPQSRREVVLANIGHDLSSGTGHADLIVEGLVFDGTMQPDTLTPLALGVIANAEGTLRGEGRIDWNGTGVTSTGRFNTDRLDFAAAFGPVKGASGTIEFTDLLDLVTAPDQTLRVASINPGIEVNDGLVTYALLPGRILRVKGARWPFLEGRLRLRAVDIPLGSDDPVRYVLVINGIDAARFIEHIDMGNIAATGTFDGRLPLVFDKDGGRIERGRLTSREPGGNLSYVGELTYEDLSAMGNFAFNALRSVDYRQMAIQFDGPLDGEIITRVEFEGISQGEGASSNFITKRIARLPILFRLNIRAPFFQLVSSMRSLYDPEYVRDPRQLGIIPAGASAASVSRPPGVQAPASGARP
jgi:hypothetical protein